MLYCNFGGTAHLLAPVIEQVKRFTEQAGSENLFYVLKTIGIAVISHVYRIYARKLDSLP